MSKRSSRRKRREQAKKKTARLTAPVLTQQGKTAFSQADYSAAIDAWEQAGNKPNVPAGLPTALAEAYFRRAFTSPNPVLTDLQQAVKLVPTDPRYRYHLAVAYHRLDQIEQAEPLYRQLLAESPPLQRAAFPLAQLLVEKGQDVTPDPVWSHLSEEEQNYLSAVLALSRNRPVAALRYISPGQADYLWSGLAAFTLGEGTTARQDLEAVLDMPELHPLSRSVVHYYLGVLAAQAGQTESALTHWRTAQNDGLNIPHLRQNLAIMLYRQALTEQQAGRPSQALNLLEQSHSLSSSAIPDLVDLRWQLHLEAGYADSQQGRWADALRHWQAAQEAGDNSRQLITNLALANDQLGQFRQAAELWREVLRRRPRSAHHPDALNDEQVARLWQHVAESYSKAGDYEQAITTYGNALKWSPENIDLRLSLVDILQAEGRWQAADNELERILEKWPDHVPALMRQAESYESDGDLEKARHVWQRILELEPQHSVAGPQLAHLYEKEGLRYAIQGKFKKALSVYQEGLRQVPDNPDLYTYIGAIYADLNDFDQARRYFEQALALDPANLSTFHFMLLVWLDHWQLDEVDRTLETVKTLDPPAPASFLLELAEHCSKANLNNRTWNLLEYAERLYPDDPEVLMEIAWRLSDDDQDARAIGYLRRILRQNPKHAEANMWLGTIYYTKDQRHLARRHWNIAEQQARKENDIRILTELRMTKNALVHGILPPSRGLANLLDDMPPELADFLDELEI